VFGRISGKNYPLQFGRLETLNIFKPSHLDEEPVGKLSPDLSLDVASVQGGDGRPEAAKHEGQDRLEGAVMLTLLIAMLTSIVIIMLLKTSA